MNDGQRDTPTSFFPVTSINVGTSMQRFLTFCVILFATVLENFKNIPSASLKFLNFNQDHSSKISFFWSNPQKIEVMITPLTEMLDLPNFGHMITWAT